MCIPSTAPARCFLPWYHLMHTSTPSSTQSPNSPPPDSLKYLGSRFTDEGFEAQRGSVTCSKYTVKMRKSRDLEPNLPNSKALALSTMPHHLLPKAHSWPIMLLSESLLLTLAITKGLSYIFQMWVMSH